jgi:hypothetical protein
VEKKYKYLEKGFKNCIEQLKISALPMIIYG